MVQRVSTVAFEGIEARAVDVQVQVAPGIPAFNVVGLPDKAVSEARERVRAALVASGLALPARRITVNLAPADVPKEGSHYDLPIALGLMAAIGAIPPMRWAVTPCWASSASTARSRRSPACCRRRSAPMPAARV
jgi:magnesium chelatase family protein